ncbi:C40 family peptidase [Corynebacterium timonense]|uniref:Cell wall-associated hydrolase, NlpC family n=1 Tax=Corynebacterium timonense TaxID=441500 RepID=A0A1H1S6R2_9CORY|nr:C40 family peptidase [Corynebacterium timonense]SDS43593.1 Cell wall-associated hydrolase, NlpC family [Corynebacterium timonense]
MITPAQIAAAIIAHAPAPVAVPAAASSPLLSAARELGPLVGADPARVLSAAEALAADRETIARSSAAAAVLAAEAGADLVALAARYQQQAAPLVGLALTPLSAPGAVTSLVALTVRTLALAHARVSELERDLAPLAQRLAAIPQRAAAEPEIAAGPAAHEAARDLHAMAATDSEPSASPASPPQAPVPAPDGGEGSAAGRAAVAAAKSQLGTPYAWGGTGPGGFDCSGLTSWAYRQAGVELPRMAHEQAVGRQVTYQELQPGDLAVWDGHVAMYAGDGMYIEAGDPVQMNPVRTENIGMGFRGFWRPTG